MGLHIHIFFLLIAFIYTGLVDPSLVFLHLLFLVIEDSTLSSDAVTPRSWNTLYPAETQEESGGFI